ncbi:hypothetical protein FNZ56_01230 [Pseudoluteimonas lycopersici]|uniref:Uncharacterized protein n=1 Tax=Pseudoluteimonas lycopersici TaxID=1324796 RepID=A0A516V250_9GAMM|nr:hypothetical protein [Lysobacter lycopersici]QDQ72596.1 hypothetical protein FNZ56_01230 [Lysobacter lycopersici]
MILIVIGTIFSGYIFFGEYRAAGISAADYWFASVIGLGCPLASCLSALSILKDSSDLPPPARIVCSRIQPFAGAVTWLFVVAMVFPNPVSSDPPWKLLLDRPWTLIVLVFVASIFSPIILMRGWLLFQRIRMKFDPKFRANAERLSKVIEDHR